MTAPTVAPGIEPVSVPPCPRRSPLPRALIAAAAVIMVMSLVGHVAERA